MKIKNILGFMLLFTAALFVQSCSDDDNASAPASVLTVTKDGKAIDSLSFQMAATNTMIGVSTDGDWTASIPDADTTWLSITPHSGYGWNATDTSATNTKAYIKVSVAKNESSLRRSAITITAGNLTKVINVSQNGVGMDPNDPFESSYSLVEHIKLGYNLGNTLESNPEIATSTWIDFSKGPEAWETAWGQPVTTQDIVDSIAAKGFNIMRVPVTWYQHQAADGTIDEAWMDRVEQVVDYVLNAHMYCILVVQHDAGARSAGRQDDAGWLTGDPDKYAENSARLKNLWTQIANRFKDKDEHLIFDGFNEILDKNWSWTAPADPADPTYTTINKLQQDFVDAVRATGGNNEYRNLMINGYGSSSTQPVLDALQVPTDVHPNHLLLSIHSYDPFWFCNDTSNNDDKQYYINMFDESCKSEIDAIFSRVNKRCDDLHIPYIFGEFGAIGTHPDMNERIKYATYMVEKFNAYKTTGLWWMGLYDRNENEWYEPEIVNALFSTKK